MKLTATLFLSFVITFCFGQTETTKDTFYEIQDIVLIENQLYGIDKNGQLIKWDLETGVRENLSNDTSIMLTSIQIDRNSNLVLGSSKGLLFELHPDTKEFILKKRLKKEVEIRDIIINSKNEIFLVVPGVIYDTIKDKYWKGFIHRNSQIISKKRFLFFFTKKVNKYFQMPQNTFIDNDDIIWMISNYGEFGGTIQRFDTKKRKEINTIIEGLGYTMFFPQNIFSDGKHIYISSGLQHFRNFGEIWKISYDKAQKIFKNGDFIDQYLDKIFIGPSLIDSQTNIIYISSSEGIFKAELSQDEKIKEIELLFVPELFWDREPLAIGAKMSIKKLLLTKDKQLIFLTSKNGVGIYNKGKLNYLK